MVTVASIPRSLVFLLLANLFLHGCLILHGLWKPQSYFTQDSSEYLDAGYNLFDHGTVYSGKWQRKLHPALLSRRPPAYPFFVGVLGLVSRDSVLIVLAQIALHLAGGVLLWKILNLYESAVPYGVRLLVLAGYLFYPPQLIYSHMIMAEFLLQFLLLTALFGVAKFVRTRNGSWLLLVNGCLGLAALTKPVMAYFWLPNLLFAFWLYLRTGYKTAVTFAFIPLLLVSAWSARNYQKTGYFHFSSVKISAMALMTGKRNEAAAQDLNAFRGYGQSVQADYFRSKLQHWPHTLRMHGLGLIGFFLDPGRFDIYQLMGWKHEFRLPQLLRVPLSEVPARVLSVFSPWILAYLALLTIANLIVLMAFCRFVFSSSPVREVRVFLVLVVIYMAAITGQIAVSRYRLSVEPYLILTLPALISWFRSLRRAEASPENGS